LSRAQSSLLALVAAAAMAAAGCATFERVSTNAKLGLESRVTKPFVYRFSGVDPAVRANLNRGRSELAARNYRGAVPLLNRAVWDLERIQRRGLRLEELVVAYDGLAHAHLAIGADDLAREHRRLSRALGEAEARSPASGVTQVLTKAKDAYVSARFRDAVRGLQQALIDLEDIEDLDTRVRRLADARCYLAFAYFAIERRERVRDELRRLWALDPSREMCRHEAPPGVRALIVEVQRKQKDQ
jgi:tetratricopeptide (TPR) repeat protein